MRWELPSRAGSPRFGGFEEFFSKVGAGDLIPGEVNPTVEMEAVVSPFDGPVSLPRGARDPLFLRGGTDATMLIARRRKPKT